MLNCLADKNVNTLLSYPYLTGQTSEEARSGPSEPNAENPEKQVTLRSLFQERVIQETALHSDRGWSKQP